MPTFQSQRIERDGLLIRTYEPRDAGAVWDLHVEGLIDMNTYDEHNRDPQWDADVRDIPIHYLVPGSHFWVVEDGGNIIATAAVRQIADVTSEIKRMRVTKTHRRRGIGRMLVDVIEDYCRGCGHTRIILDTSDRQEPAQRLYEALGYIRTGERYLPQIEMTLFYYAKDLA